MKRLFLLTIFALSCSSLADSSIYFRIGYGNYFDIVSLEDSQILPVKVNDIDFTVGGQSDITPGLSVSTFFTKSRINQSSGSIGDPPFNSSLNQYQGEVRATFSLNKYVVRPRISTYVGYPFNIGVENAFSYIKDPLVYNIGYGYRKDLSENGKSSSAYLYSSIDLLLNDESSINATVTNRIYTDVVRPNELIVSLGITRFTPYGYAFTPNVELVTYNDKINSKFNIRVEKYFR